MAKKKTKSSGPSMSTMREVSVEAFRALSKSQNLETGMDSAYTTLKRAYARREIELLAAVQAMESITEKPGIRDFIIKYAKRISSDPNFIEAKQSSEFLTMKLEALKARTSSFEPEDEVTLRKGKKILHEALAKIFDFYPGQHMGDVDRELIFDLNLLQHLPDEPLPVGKKGPVRPRIKFVDSFTRDIRAKKDFDQAKKIQDKQAVRITSHRTPMGKSGTVPSK